jgi:hypothetical protein
MLKKVTSDSVVDVLGLKWKIKTITLSEQFQNPIEKIVERGKIDTPITWPITFLAWYRHFNKILWELN